ncbi:Pentatricopeptide repeat-containing protein [Platanthera zijinensis]|uniref:Pentatricopeptide repeat-containing protein n=1 Tax=Platanthera zijinensis TaxID=2320716 RepID=A0AAP0BL70_9ASPA
MFSAYDRLGDFESADQLLKQMPDKNDFKTVLRIFKSMQAAQVAPTQLTVVSVLGACAETGAFDLGREVHGFLMEKEIEIQGFVGNALVDMYVKCRNLKLAQEVFDMMSLKHVTCWNSMIVAFAIHGLLDEAYKVIKEMPVGPNSVLWKTLMAACKVHDNAELAEAVFREIAMLE